MAQGFEVSWGVKLGAYCPCEVIAAKVTNPIEAKIFFIKKLVLQTRRCIITCSEPCQSHRVLTDTIRTCQKKSRSIFPRRTNPAPHPDSKTTKLSASFLMA